MAKHPTTVRLDSHLQKQVMKAADKAGLTFSGVVHLLLVAFTEGTVKIGVTQYAPSYIKTLEHEGDELRRDHRKGRVKSYASSKALFDDILKR